MGIAVAVDLTGIQVFRRIEIIGTVDILQEQVGETVELIVRTEGHRVDTHRLGQVVGQGVDVLIEVVGLGGTLVTDADGTVAHAADLEHRELGTEGFALVADTHVGDTELVVQVIGQTALELTHEGVGLGHEVVAVVGSVQIGSGAHGIELLGAHQAVTEGSVMLVVDVPVQFGRHFVGLGIDLQVGREGTRVLITLGLGLVHDIIVNLLGNIALHLGSGGTQTVGIRIFLVGALVAGEEEEFVLDDGTADGHTGLIGLLIGILVTLVAIGLGVTADEVLGIAITIDAAMELIGTGLGDSVDGTTGETALTHIEGSDAHLDLLDGFHGNRLSTGLSTVGTVVRQTEHVIVHGTIDLEAVVLVGSTGEGHTTVLVRTDERIDTGHIGDTTGNGRHLFDGTTGNRLGSASFGSIKCTLGHNHSLFESQRSLFQNGSHIGRLTQIKGDVGNLGVFIAHQAHGNHIGATGTHTLDSIAALTTGNGVIGGSRRNMNRDDNSTGNNLALGVGNLTGNGRSRYLRIRSNTREQSDDRKCNNLEGMFHKINNMD